MSMFPQTIAEGGSMLRHIAGQIFVTDPTALDAFNGSILVGTDTTLWVHWQVAQGLQLVPNQASIGLTLDDVPVAGSAVPMLAAGVSGSFTLHAAAGQVVKLVNFGPDSIDFPQGGNVVFSAVRLQ
jgi:hypothetical protein